MMTISRTPMKNLLMKDLENRFTFIYLKTSVIFSYCRIRTPFTLLLLLIFIVYK